MLSWLDIYKVLVLEVQAHVQPCAVHGTVRRWSVLSPCADAVHAVMRLIESITTGEQGKRYARHTGLDQFQPSA